MNVPKMISIVFSTVGVSMLLGRFFIYSRTSSFVAGASEAEGKVIALDRSRSSSSSGSRTTYRPVVEFTAAGARIEFTSSVGSNPPSHRIGEPVTVLYSPADPYRAKIKSFFSIWFGFLIVFFMGLVFTAIGLGIIFVRSRGRKRAEWLRRHGRRIQTAYKGVELNRTLQVNGRSPYQIISQSPDPASNTVRVFESENIWFDPTEYIKGESIDVLVDPTNPGKYVMDISFLPRLAE